eukprot:COSAG05_NODE_800_length_7226_cov_4.300126_1_plen_63_part_00
MVDGQKGSSSSVGGGIEALNIAVALRYRQALRQLLSGVEARASRHADGLLYPSSPESWKTVK